MHVKALQSGNKLQAQMHFIFDFKLINSTKVVTYSIDNIASKFLYTLDYWVRKPGQNNETLSDLGT